MKLTGKLKDKVDAVKTMEEKKAVIAEAGMELTNDELEGVAGGHPASGIYQWVTTPPKPGSERRHSQAIYPEKPSKIK